MREYEIKITGYKRTFRVIQIGSSGVNPYDREALNSWLLRYYANYTDMMSRLVLFRGAYTVKRIA